MDARRRRRLQGLSAEMNRLDREIEEIKKSTPVKKVSTERATATASRETSIAEEVKEDFCKAPVFVTAKSSFRKSVPSEVIGSVGPSPGNLSTLTLSQPTPAKPARRRIEIQDSDSELDSDEEEFLRKLGSNDSEDRKLPAHPSVNDLNRKPSAFERGESDRQGTSDIIQARPVQAERDSNYQEAAFLGPESSGPDRSKGPKPEFSNPRFPPTAYEPLRLGQGADMTAVPATIARYLPQYQKEGVQFIYNAIINEGGGLLGDDMGCGKTIQMTALIAALLEKSGLYPDQIDVEKRQKLARNWKSRVDRMSSEALRAGDIVGYQKSHIPDFDVPRWAPILIISPNSVVPNWVKDLDDWGYFSVQYLSNKKMPIESIWENEIAVIKRSWLQDEKFVKEKLSAIPWRLVVIDEVHYFKNPEGKYTKNLYHLRDMIPGKMIGLTGTAMQNNHKELHTLFNLIVKDFFEPWREFDANFAKPIKHGMTKKASMEATTLARAKSHEIQMKLSRVYIRRTKEQVLKDVLPEKEEKVILCELSSLQKKLYRHILQLPDYLLLKFARCPCDCGVNSKFFIEYQRLRTPQDKLKYHRDNRQKIIPRADCCGKFPIDESGGIDDRAVLFKLHQHHPHPDPKYCPGCMYCPYCIMFPAMKVLEKLSSHASLIQAPASAAEFFGEDGTGGLFGANYVTDEGVLFGNAAHAAKKKLDYARTFIPPELLHYFPGGYIRQPSILNQHFELSGKCKVLHKLLIEIQRRNGRVLIFSQYTETLTLLETMLTAQGMTFIRMDGQTQEQERKRLAEKFQRDPQIFIFLLSTKAMGVGLNLQAATNVVIFDCDWNPANDAQAQDRAYRIGQSQDVNVYRLIAEGTLEEQKYLRTIYKTQLRDRTMNESGNDQNDRAGIFRGVADDDMRRGELFGIQNLLKFKEGPFMNYRGFAKRKQGEYFDGIVSSNAIMEHLKEMSEEDLENIGDEVEDEASPPRGDDEFFRLEVTGNNAAKQSSGVQSQNRKDGVGNDRSSGNVDESSVEENEMESIGGESQAVMEIADSIYVAPEADATRLNSTSDDLIGTTIPMFDVKLSKSPVPNQTTSFSSRTTHMPLPEKQENFSSPINRPSPSVQDRTPEIERTKEAVALKPEVPCSISTPVVASKMDLSTNRSTMQIKQNKMAPPAASPNRADSSRRAPIPSFCDPDEVNPKEETKKRNLALFDTTANDIANAPIMDFYVPKKKKKRKK